jgi:Na+/H+-translocating membrane pyrophosphatase
MHDLDPVKMATAGIFYNLQEADVVVGLLESCGIDCLLCDEHMHRVHPLASDVIGGVRVQVREQDLEVARELLKEYVPMPEPPATIE